VEVRAAVAVRRRAAGRLPLTDSSVPFDEAKVQSTPGRLEAQSIEAQSAVISPLTWGFRTGDRTSISP